MIIKDFEERNWMKFPVKNYEHFKLSTGDQTQLTWQSPDIAQLSGISYVIITSQACS